MYRIRRFGIIKTATIAAAFYAVGTFILCAVLALLVAVLGAGSGLTGSQFGGGAAGFLILGVVGGLLYGVFGWIITAIMCALYNLVAGYVGGIEVQVEAVTPPAPAPTWGPITPGGYGPPPASGPQAPGAPTSTAAQVPWSSPAPPANPTTDTAPYDPSAPRND